MQPVEGGIARLDTRTGAIELCRVEAKAIACADERTTGLGDRARIAAPPDDGRERSGAGRAGPAGGVGARLDALEARVSALESRSAAVGDEQPGDLAVRRMQEIFRSFADIVRDLDEDLDDDGDDDGAVPEAGREPSAIDRAMPGRT